MSWAAFGMGALNKLVGNLSDTYGTGEKLRDVKRREAREDYLSNERMGIQARVEGAKAAGLHPLAALGFQSGAPATYVGGGDPIQPGQWDSGPPPQQQRTEAKADPLQVRIMEANARRAEAEAELSEINAHNAMRALATQPGNGPPNMIENPTLPTEKGNLNPVSSKPIRGVKIVPNEIESSTGGTTQGIHPGGTWLQIPGGPSIQLPSKAFADRSDDLDLLKYWAIATMNKDRLIEWSRDNLTPFGRLEKYLMSERDPLTAWSKQLRLSKPKLKERR